MQFRLRIRIHQSEYSYEQYEIGDSIDVKRSDKYLFVNHFSILNKKVEFCLLVLARFRVQRYDFFFKKVLLSSKKSSSFAKRKSLSMEKEDITLI